MDESTPRPDPQSGQPQSDPPPDPPFSFKGIEFMTLGLTVAVTIVICGVLGYLLDRWLGTTPLFVLIGLALGVTAAVLTTVSRVRKYL